MINVEIQRQRKAASKTYEVIKERDQLHLLQRADDIFKSGGLYPTFIRKNLVQIFYDVNRLDQRLLFAIPIAQKHRDSELQEFCQAMIADYTRNCIELSSQKSADMMQLEASTVLPLQEVAISELPPPSLALEISSLVKPKTELDIQSKSRQRANPSLTAHDFIEKVPIRIYREGYYVFLDGYYQLFSEIKMKRILNHFYREEAERFRFAKFYDEVLQFVQCEQDLVVTNDCFEETKYLVSFKNGILDTYSMRFIPSNPNYFITSSVNAEYLPDKRECPQFDYFISIIANNDIELINRIYEIIGLIISNDPDAKAIFCAQGVTNSGKSTLIKFISSLFSEEQVTAVAINGLDRNFALKEFIGKSLCTDTELSPEPLKSAWIAKLKQLSSTDPLSTDVKFKDYATFVYRGKIFLATNHRFLLTTPDDAFMRRMVAIPFVIEIHKRSANTNILKTFESEKAAIINKAIWHYRRLRENNYIFSGEFEINQMFDVINSEASPLLTKKAIVEQFICNQIEVTSDLNDYLSTKEISEMCNRFCIECKYPCIEQKELTRLLKSILGADVVAGKHRFPDQPNPLNVLCGIRIKNMMGVI